MDSNMCENEEYGSIRCPNERSRNDFKLCGRLLGAEKDGKIYLYCEICKQFFEIVIKENHNIEMKKLPKKERLRLKNTLRVIEPNDT